MNSSKIPAQWLALFAAIGLEVLASWAHFPALIADMVAAGMILGGMLWCAKYKSREQIGNYQLALLVCAWAFVVVTLYVGGPAGAALIVGLLALFATVTFFGSSFSRTTQLTWEGIVILLGVVLITWVLTSPYESAAAIGDGMLKPLILVSGLLLTILALQILVAVNEGRHPRGP